ncbi:MAG: cytochrome c oxidase subunit 3 [Caldilineaceae bacterium]|nr:cytochrome c oxidase subunit 3 [Caldilineaceae bacterium]
METTYGAYFLTITGIHGTHVLIGIVWASLLLAAFLDDPATDLAGRIEVFGLYWHFVDVVWIILFTLFYLVR